MAGSPKALQQLMLDTTENAVHQYSIERREGEAAGADYDTKNAMPIYDGGAYISSATTTYVETGPCVFGSIVVGETAAGAITVYNNTTATGTAIAVLKSSIAEGTYTFNRECDTGLTVVTAAASKLTVNTRKSTV